MLFGGDGSMIQRGPVATNVPDVTGLATGLDTSNVEMATLASVSGNTVRFLNTQDLSQQSLTPVTPGPVTAIPFRELIGDAPSVLTHGFYHSGGQDLQLFQDVLSATPVPGAISAIPGSFRSLQPYRIPDSYLKCSNYI